MEPKRQKDAMRHLIQEGMRVEIAEKMDLETLLFVDNSKNPDNEIDEKNYKWVTSGDGYNEFPFKKWQLKNFFYELLMKQNHYSLDSSMTWELRN